MVRVKVLTSLTLVNKKSGGQVRPPRRLMGGLRLLANILRSYAGGHLGGPVGPQAGLIM